MSYGASVYLLSFWNICFPIVLMMQPPFSLLNFMHSWPYYLDLSLVDGFVALLFNIWNRWKVNRIYHIFVPVIIEHLNSYLEQLNTLLRLTSGLWVVFLLNCYSDRFSLKEKIYIYINFYLGHFFAFGLMERISGTDCKLFSFSFFFGLPKLYSLSFLVKVELTS